MNIDYDEYFHLSKFENGADRAISAAYCQSILSKYNIYYVPYVTLHAIIL